MKITVNYKNGTKSKFKADYYELKNNFFSINTEEKGKDKEVIIPIGNISFIKKVDKD